MLLKFSHRLISKFHLILFHAHQQSDVKKVKVGNYQEMAQFSNMNGNSSSIVETFETHHVYVYKPYMSIVI